ncbi:MAG TPA: DUF2254 domain-containing protein [Xanthobacteraceae bacterium]|nr:DUF2254 domain-containing protein [Xanthobacteraceae bacterium]
MNWRQRYYFTSYVRSSLWIVPFVAIPLELVVTRLAHWADASLGWTLLGFATSGAQATLQAIVTATLSFVVFTFGSLLVAIQVAGGQLTSRIIATTLLRDNVVKYTVGLFIFTLLFALSAQDRVDTKVHQLVLFLAASLGLLSFAAFFYLIDYASRLLRPISILARVGQAGLAVIENVYPEQSRGAQVADVPRAALGPPDRVIPHHGTSGIVLAANVEALVAAAERCDGTIEFVPQVGDFVAVDEPLFNLYGKASALDDDELRSAVALGSERTMEQDPTFAFRIVIDIALRALSSAINDPTTAVLALDQLHRLLRMVGKRHLRTDEIVDKSGRLRVIFRTPNWEDFVHLAFSETRDCGSGNLQVARRLRAMLDNLVLTLPEHRHPALREELTLLDREIEKRFQYPEVLALARVGDSQGLGGHSSR